MAYRKAPGGGGKSGKDGGEKRVGRTDHVTTLGWIWRCNWIHNYSHQLGYESTSTDHLALLCFLRGLLPLLLPVLVELRERERGYVLVYTLQTPVFITVFLRLPFTLTATVFNFSLLRWSLLCSLDYHILLTSMIRYRAPPPPPPHTPAFGGVWGWLAGLAVLGYHKLL